MVEAEKSVAAKRAKGARAEAEAMAEVMCEAAKATAAEHRR